ncbi:MAG: nuclear transport factor 2 family protein [Acidobacteria bacterium]|nr:nuclear transport factor 2 family protein [Acidobacteriota bacterium]
MPQVPAQDYVEIQNLYALYNLCSDAGDAEGYAACFTEDGVLVLATIGLTVTGRESFEEFKRRDKAGRPHIYRRHWNGSIHLEQVDATTVRGRCYLLAFNGTPAELPAIADCGVYEDTIVKENGAWKFARRHLEMDATTFKSPVAKG